MWYAAGPATKIRGNSTDLADRHDTHWEYARLYLELVDSGMNHGSR